LQFFWFLIVQYGLLLYIVFLNKLFRNLPRFAQTRNSCQLMERIAIGISKVANKPSEAILLIGETGVGKTSIVQVIASYLNVHLCVINLSHDSEYYDLIGGYERIFL